MKPYPFPSLNHLTIPLAIEKTPPSSLHERERSKRIGESLMPALSKVAGVGGYDAIEAEDGVFRSFGLFDNSAQADESTRIAANWVRDEKLETIMPNAPKITSGTVVAQKLTN